VGLLRVSEDLVGVLLYPRVESLHLFDQPVRLVIGGQTSEGYVFGDCDVLEHFASSASRRTGGPVCGESLGEDGAPAANS
jgi:hypothetical protein